MRTSSSSSGGGSVSSAPGEAAAAAGAASAAAAAASSVPTAAAAARDHKERLLGLLKKEVGSTVPSFPCSKVINWLVLVHAIWINIQKRYMYVDSVRSCG